MTSPFLVAHNGQRIGERALPDDDPLLELRELEQSINATLEDMKHKLEAQVQSLGNKGIDVDMDSIVDNCRDVVSDHVGVEMNKLEDQR